MWKDDQNIMSVNTWENKNETVECSGGLYGQERCKTEYKSGGI